MITIDRTDRGRKNYFRQTMEQLARSGLWSSQTPFELHIYDSGSKSLDFMGIWPSASHVTVHASYFKLHPKINAGRALLAGSEYPCDLVVFLEDDILVCKDFLDGVAAFTLKHDRPDYRVFTFYTPYREVEWAHAKGEACWEYPLASFYGTQGFALRREDAASLGRHLMVETNYDPNTPSYDLIMKDWHKAAYPDSPYFLATVPSFVQHVGEESYLFDDVNRFHACGSFKGEQWSALSQ